MATETLASPTKQRVTVSYDGYNPRRYSKPWIARVIAWPIGGKPQLQWGGYCGDHNGGEVEIMAAPGDIIRDGQRDDRKTECSINDWSVVTEDYTLRKITQTEARKFFGSK